jgi:hypothetical protein
MFTVLRTLASRAAAFALMLVAAIASHLGAQVVPATYNPALVSNLSEAMKIVFDDALINNVVYDSEWLSRIQTDSNIRTDETTGGRWVEMAHYFQLPAGVGARFENEYIPMADAAVFKNSRAYLAKIQGVVEMTGDVMRRVATSEAAFLDYAAQALPDFSKRLTSELDRMALGVGHGAKARVQAVSAYNSPAAGQFTVNLTSALGVGTPGTAAAWGQGWLQFLEGERVVFASTIGFPTTLLNAGAAQSAQVIGINEAGNSGNGTLTLSGAQTLRDAINTAIASNPFIFAGDTAGSSAPGTAPSGSAVGHKEIQGLLAGVDNGNILQNYNNLDRSLAGNRLWNSIVLDGAAAPYGGVLTEELLTFADDESAVLGAAKIDLLLTNRSGMRGYWKHLKNDRFFIDPRGNYSGGKNNNGLEIILGDRTVPMAIARKLPFNTTFGLQLDTWRRLSLGQWEWDDKTGAIWNRATDATGRRDAYYAVGNMYEQLLCTAPRKNFRIDGLANIA